MNKVIKNSIFLLIANSAGKLFYFIATITIINKAGYETFGRFAWGMSIVMLISILGDFGVDKIFIRESSKNPEKIRDVHSLFCGKILIFIPVLILFFMISGIKDIFLVILVLSFLIKALLNLNLGIIESRQEMEKESLIILFGNLSFLLLVIVFSKNVVMISLSYLLSAAIQFIFSFKMAKIPFKIGDPIRFIQYIKVSFPIGIIVLFTILTLRLNTIMVKLFQGDIMTGYYESVWDIIIALLIIPNAFTTAYFPHISAKEHHNERTFSNVTMYAIILAMIAMLLQFTLNNYAGQLLNFIYRETYPIQVQTFKILLLSLIPIFFSSVLIFFYYSVNRLKTVLSIIVIKGVTNFILNIFLISSFDIRGAAWSMFLSESLCSILLFTVFVVKFRK